MRRDKFDTFCAKETMAIIQEKMKPTKSRENKSLNRLLFIAAALFFWSFSPSIIHSNEGAVTGRLFPDTWRCVKCGYENYFGISNCATCGKAK